MWCRVLGGVIPLVLARGWFGEELIELGLYLVHASLECFCQWLLLSQVLRVDAHQQLFGLVDDLFQVNILSQVPGIESSNKFHQVGDRRGVKPLGVAIHIR